MVYCSAQGRIQGGVFGVWRPPPLHNTLGKQKEGWVVIKTLKNVLFLELNAILAVLKERIHFFSKGLHPPHPLYPPLKDHFDKKKSSLYVNIENKPFRSNFHASIMQHPIASGGRSPPDPCFRDPPLCSDPPFKKSWIRPCR